MKTRSQQLLDRYKYSKTFLDKREYTHYRMNYGKPLRERIKGRDEFSKFVKLFYDTIADQMLESENGVYIEGLGYFYNMMCCKEMKGIVKYGKIIMNTPLNSYPFSPTFVGAEPLRLFSLRKSRFIKRELYTRLKKGKKYRSWNYYLMSKNKIK